MRIVELENTAGFLKFIVELGHLIWADGVVVLGSQASWREGWQ